MARRIPTHRFETLVRAATEVFIARGYRLTQMSDIAEAVGVAKGTLYGYVESKDALLVLCLAKADDPGPIELPASLPLPALPPGALGQSVKEALVAESAQPRLESALAQTGPVESVSAEARAVLSELYDLMAAHRHRIKLLDRCMDHPELGGLWQTAGRESTQRALERYIEFRVRSGDFRPVANAGLAARIVLETCATWAVHIHWDRAPEAFDPEEAREAVIEQLVRGLLS